MRNALFLLILLLGCATAAPRDRDLAPITRLACRNDIVLLGELPSHGEARAFEMKARIVQALVQECGFDAVLFEAPIYDFVGFNEAVAQGQADTTALNNAIGRFWLTRELAPFRTWLYARASRGELVAGGLDDQVSATSRYARSRLPRLFAGECAETVKRNLEWTYSDAVPFDMAEQTRLRACARPSAQSRDVLLRNYSSYVDRQVEQPGARTRDEVMLDNLRWYLDRLPKSGKVVVWTASVHAARQQGEIPYRPLGAQLVEAGHRVAAIGFTAARGESSMAGRPPRPLADLPPGALETIRASGGTEWTFLDAAALARIGPASSRLLGRIVTGRWNEYFDGVVIIQNEVAPTW